jgi:hypothetical protein
MGHFWLYGAAQESNLPSLGLPDLTGFEDKCHLAPELGLKPLRATLRASPKHEAVRRDPFRAPCAAGVGMPSRACARMEAIVRMRGRGGGPDLRNY